MLNAIPLAKPRGFTLIEMLIVIAIIAIATTLGLPSYRTWVHNTQIRTAAESIQGGLQKARAEAVKRNANIELVLGVDPPWLIRVAGGAEIERSTTEGAKNVAKTVTPTGKTIITFNSFGTIGVPPNQPKNTDGSDPFTQVEFTSSVLDAADARNLRVTIGNAGNIRMCDPSPSLAATDPRKC